jgi:Zn-dependent protease with chaperone function
MTAACAVAAIATGLPISLAIAPLIFAFVLVLTWLLDLVAPVPQAVWDFYERALLVIYRVFEYFDDTVTDKPNLTDALAAALVWLLPGILLMLLIWPAMRLLFRRGGSEGILLSFGARAPRPGDLEERQLVNVIEEMAIAANLPAPRVMLIDSAVANAAVIGSSPRDATIVVSRALLDDLDREETQGILANLVASIGNGDLGIALSIIAVFQTFGFASALLRAPVSGDARRTVWRVVRFAFSRHTDADRAAESAAVSGLLTRGLQMEDSDDMAALQADDRTVQPRRGPPLTLLMYFPIPLIGVWVAYLLEFISRAEAWLFAGGLIVLALWILWYQRRYAIYVVGELFDIARMMVILPYYMASMLPSLMLMMLTSFMLEPMLAFVWRTRRYLADATAVQLTRNPDWIAEGLVASTDRGGMIPGGKWAAPLFVVGPEARSMRSIMRQRSAVQQRIDERVAASGKTEGVGRLIAEAQAMAESTQEQRRELMTQAAIPGGVEKLGAHYAPEGSFSGSSGSVVSFHPALKKRLAKLQALGSSVSPSDWEQRIEARHAGASAARQRWNTWKYIIGPVLVVLWLVIGALMLVALALMLLLTLGATGLLMLVVYGLFTLLAP